MKYNSKILIFAILAMLILGLNSCYDEKMEWGDPYRHPASKDLPLELQEKISRYEVLNAYTDFVLGVGIDFSLYMNDENYRNIVNANFVEVTPGNELKQSSLMSDNGTLDFSKVDPIIDALHQAGLTVYGHTLVWHSQQRGKYLRGLIKGTSLSVNMIIKGGDFETYTAGDVNTGYPDWNGWGGKASPVREISADGEGYGGGKALLIHSSGTTQFHEVQALSDMTEALIVGHKYHVEAMIKSSVDNGEVQIEFQGGSATYLPSEVIGTEWTKMQRDFTATNANTKIVFDVGKISGDYYIDNVVVFDLGKVNMIVKDGDFETYTAGDVNTGYPDWNGWGGKASPVREISADGEGYGGGKALLIHSSGTTQFHEVQALSDMTEPLIVGHKYHVEAMIKSSIDNGEVQIEFQGGSATYLPSEVIGTEWTKMQRDFTATNANTKIVFDVGKISADYYIDNVVVYDVTAITSGAGGEVIPLPEDEVKARISAALENYIKGVAGHFSGKVTAWDVVNEPMNDSGSGLKTDKDNTSPADDRFYWQDYLGKDYAVNAFKWAKEADANAKFFINDYNLESSEGKLNGLIDYVKYIESQGATVDGIGTQMHLNINWSDTTKIEAMFQKLAATGKLIKISELDIAISNSSENPESPISPTSAEFEKQAKLYEFVAKAYNKYIPVAQRYGITVWSVSDNEAEHEYWLKNDAPCLWDADYARKYAYKGFADGLAGKDVSADFSGDLQY